MPRTGTRRANKSKNPDDPVQSDNEGNLMLHSKGCTYLKQSVLCVAFDCNKGFSMRTSALGRHLQGQCAQSALDSPK